MPRQDKQQKDRDERDEDERDEDEREEEDEADDASDDDDDESESDDGESSEAEESDDDDAEPDEAAQRVAKALGVGVVSEDDSDGEAKVGAEGESEDKPEETDAGKPNRAARRREEALARRKKRAAADVSSINDEVSSVSDKNVRAKDLLKRRREQAASAARAPVASSLDAGEMVDDALARSMAAIGKWFKTNVQFIQWVVVIGLVGAGGYVLYNMRSEKKAGEASAKLVAGIAADRGIVLEEDKRSDDEKEYDSRRVFKTTSERVEASLGSFNSVVEQHGGSGAALLAKLGQGGAYLEKKEFDKAIASYSEVLASPLAAADPDVKGRATEGTAFAKEGKGDLDGALASFKQLSSIDVKGYKELSTYHEARVLFAKGDKAKAKELLEPLNTKLMTPSPEPQPLGYLKGAVGDLLTQVDPNAAAGANKPPTGKMPTPAELQDMARRALEQKAPPKNGTP